MALLTPLYMQPVTGDPAIQYSALQDRASLLSAVFSREGVLDVDAGQLKVAQRAAGANFSVDIASGRCAILGDDVSDQGTYLCTNTTTVNLATPTAPGSGTRRHRVIARVRDKLHNGTFTTYEWVLELLQDTGTGTPAQPNSAITLGFVNIAAGQASVTNANIEDARPRASVGTPDRTGTFAMYSGYAVVDAARPLTWKRNPDGWVSLSGFVRWTDANTALNANQLYQFNQAGSLMPTDIRASSSRDFPGISDLGPVQYTLAATGEFYFRFKAAQTLVQNVTWFSFDGCGYRV